MRVLQLPVLSVLLGWFLSIVVDALWCEMIINGSCLDSVFDVKLRVTFGRYKDRPNNFVVEGQTRID